MNVPATSASARQNTNHANRMLSVDQKVNLVLEGLSSRRSTAVPCGEAGTNRARSYHWKQQYTNAGRVGFVDAPADTRELEKRIQQLEAENAQLEKAVRIFRDMSVAD